MDHWNDAFQKMRAIALECRLTEEVKWGWPCFTFEKSNIVLIHGFTDYCAFLFFKGALMKDPEGILIRQTENVQAGRQIRFADLCEMVAREATLKAYIREAIEVEKSGQTVTKKTVEDFSVPDEFRIKLEENLAVKAAFDALTPGRRKAYLLNFSGAKQSKTRISRIEDRDMHPAHTRGKGIG